MANSGYIQTNTAFGYIRLDWSIASQNVANNTSSVNYALAIQRNTSISSTASKSYSININGVTVASGTTSIGGSGLKTIKSGTTTISHNADGTKTFNYSFSQQVDITYSGSWIGTVTGSGSGTLNTIARASQPSLITWPQTTENIGNIGATVSVHTNRASSAFTHTVRYKFGSLTGTIATGVTDNTRWTIPTSFYAQIPNSTSGTGQVFLDTYNGSTLIGTKSVTFVTTVAASVVPTIGNITKTEATAGLAAQFGVFVQSKSKLTIGINAAGGSGAGLTSWSATFDGKNYSGKNFNNNVASFTTALIGGSGNLTLSVTVTDTRGRTTSTTQSISVTAYTAPKITKFTARRITTAGVDSDEGERLAVNLAYTISNVNNKTTPSHAIRYKAPTETSYTLISNTGATYSYNQDLKFTSSPVVSGDSTYKIRVEVADYFTTVIYEIDLPTSFTLIDFNANGKGIGIGKVSERNGLEIGMEVIQEDRKIPTLLNGWVNYGSVYETAYYWKDKNNIVHITGTVKDGTATNETTIFTLPEGYRPRAREKFMVISSDNLCIVDVTAAGNVTVIKGGSSNWISLCGINFRAN